MNRAFFTWLPWMQAVADLLIVALLLAWAMLS